MHLAAGSDVVREERAVAVEGIGKHVVPESLMFRLTDEREEVVSMFALEGDEVYEPAWDCDSGRVLGGFGGHFWSQAFQRFRSVECDHDAVAAARSLVCWMRGVMDR